MTGARVESNVKIRDSLTDWDWKKKDSIRLETHTVLLHVSKLLIDFNWYDIVIASSIILLDTIILVVALFLNSVYFVYRKCSILSQLCLYIQRQNGWPLARGAAERFKLQIEDMRDKTSVEI